jgi:hypothetical protein
MYERIKIRDGVVYEQEESLWLCSNKKYCVLLCLVDVWFRTAPNVTRFEVKVGIEKRTCDTLTGGTKDETSEMYQLLKQAAQFS